MDSQRQWELTTQCEHRPITQTHSYTLYTLIFMTAPSLTWTTRFNNVLLVSRSFFTPPPAKASNTFPCGFTTMLAAVLRDWIPSSPTLLLDVTAVMRWILRKGLILGDALNQLCNHIPFSTLLESSSPSARTAFRLDLPKRFIHLDQNWLRPISCPK